jgi:hypothetical protein
MDNAAGGGAQAQPYGKAWKIRLPCVAHLARMDIRAAPGALFSQIFHAFATP